MDLILSAILIFVAFVLIFLGVFIIDIIRAKKHNQKYRFKPMLASFLFLLPAIVLAFFFVVNGLLMLAENGIRILVTSKALDISDINK